MPDAITLQQEGPVFIMTMNTGENRFNRAFIDALNAALDTVEASRGPAALVTTGGTEKFYSNGLDLTWMTGDEGQAEGPRFVESVLKMLARVLVFPVPTVAAINGHAFAAGAMLTLAHDFRVMRADRGFFCLPEVDISIPLTPGMTALIKEKLRRDTFRDAVLTGARFGGADAVARGVVDEATAIEEVVSRAVARAGELAGKDRETYRALKRGMYAETLAVLESPAGGGTITPRAGT